MEWAENSPLRKILWWISRDRIWTDTDEGRVLETEENSIQMSKRHKVGKQREGMGTTVFFASAAEDIIDTNGKDDEKEVKLGGNFGELWLWGLGSWHLLRISSAEFWVLWRQNGQWSRILSWCEQNSLLLSSWHTGVSGQDSVQGAPYEITAVSKLKLCKVFRRVGWVRRSDVKRWIW